MGNFKIILLLVLLLLSSTHTAVAGDYSSVGIFYSSDDSVEGEIKSAIKLNLEDGWKTYWRFPGEAGLPPRFHWQDSENIEDLKIEFPAPERFSSMGIENFGYSDEVIFPINVKLKDPDREAQLKLDVEVLLCKQLCVPEMHHIEITLNKKGEANNTLVETAFKSLPQKIQTEDLKGAWLSQNEQGVYINFALESAADFTSVSDIFVESDAQFITENPILNFDDETGMTQIKAKLFHYKDMNEVKKDIQGKSFKFTLTGGDHSYEIEGIFLDKKPELTHKFWQADRFRMLLFAFIGGLILNLMPCVLPVLSIKILSVLKHKESTKKKILVSFLSSAFGIIFSFWILAVVLIALRCSGQSIGWGIQFQYPPFLVFLIMVLLFFAANLWGVFEINLPHSWAKKLSIKRFDNDFAEHFLTGAFATLLATPCTAPFLGTAIGFALARSGFEIFVIFTFMALGLALPFIVLAFSPSLFKYLPKPGKWMTVFKKILSITVIATALWLASIIVAIYNQETINDDWQKFDQALIAPAVSKGKIVFVDVTAKWCLTCKANKKFVLESADIKKALAADDVLKLQADWTKKSEEVSTYLRQNGKYGVPFNIVYSSKFPQGFALPELLSKDLVLEILEKAR